MCHWIPMGNFPMNFWGWIFSSSSQEPWCLWKQPPASTKAWTSVGCSQRHSRLTVSRKILGDAFSFWNVGMSSTMMGHEWCFQGRKNTPRERSIPKKAPPPQKKKHQEFRTINCCLRVFQIMFQGVYMLENSFKAPRLGSETFDVWTTWCSVFFCLDSSKFQWITVGFFVEM